MARRSLKPQLNQIRAWVRQGRTDAWIAHQLEVSASELREFRKQHDLNPDDENGAASEVDLRDEIEAEVEAATAEEAEQEEQAEEDEETDEVDEDEDGEPKTERRGGTRSGGGRATESRSAESGTGERPRRRRRRGRRGGRGRRKELEATFDHGERDGYGLWLDPSVKDDPVYTERWAGKREVTVRIEADQIVIRRAGESPSTGSGDADDSDE